MNEIITVYHKEGTVYFRAKDFIRIDSTKEAEGYVYTLTITSGDIRGGTEEYTLRNYSDVTSVLGALKVAYVA